MGSQIQLEQDDTKGYSLVGKNLIKYLDLSHLD